MIVLAEVAGTASRVFRDPIRGRLAADTLEGLPNITFVPLDVQLAHESIEIAADRALRGMDAIYVAVARRHRCILITLDDEVRQRAAALITVQTPAEALAALPQA